MNMPKHILAVVDSSMPATPAAHRAIELARRCGARVHLFMPAFDVRIAATAELVHPDVEHLARDAFLEQRLRWLAAWTAELVAQGVKAGCEVIWAPAPHDAVVAKVIERSPDLVTMDLEHESFLGRWAVVKPLVWRLARTCPAPLMLVREEAPALPARIAAAVDPRPAGGRPSGLDDRVAQAALSVATAANGALDLVHVFPYRRQDEGVSAKLDSVIDSLRKKDEGAFEQFAGRHSVPKERRVLLGGTTEVELLRHLELTRTDLVVLGSEYRSGLDRFFLGSTAEQVIAAAPCDVLLVRPDGFAEELARHKDLRKACATYGVRMALVPTVGAATA